MLTELVETFECSGWNELCNRFEDMFAAAGFEVPSATEEEIRMLTDTVNVDRLRNFPVELTKNDVDGIYRRVLRGLPV